MKRIIRLLCLSVILLTIYPLKVYCQPTDEEIEASIDKGINFLIFVEQQNADGSWGGDIYNFTAYTGFVLIKLCDRAYELGYDSPFDQQYPFHTNVTDGFNYLFSHVRDTYAYNHCLTGEIEMEGMYIGDGPVGFQPEMYNATLATMALGACNTPDSIIDCSGSVANGLTHFQLMQRMVDFYHWAQNQEDNNNFGGWGNRPWLSPFCKEFDDPNNPDSDYKEWGNTYSDNASSGYVIFALQYAEAMGCVIPPKLKEDLNVWIDYIQNVSEGGSGYFDPNGWLNLLRTGNLLAEMAFVGDNINTTRVQDALRYLKTYWDDPTVNADAPGWQNWPMAMYSLMKGFHSFGITSIEVDGRERSWYDEFVTQLLEKQAPEGAWYEGYWGDGITNTCWALLILEGKIKNQPPEITEILVPFEPVAISAQPINITVNYTDPDHVSGDEYTCLFDFGDGNISDSIPSTSLSASTDHTYANPGVYTVKVKVIDKGGLFDEETATNYIVIFDPSGGFVTGGGWINSPPGAYVSDPTLSGSANFGFVAKYKKGKTTPDGTTEFQFQAGDLNFHSTIYEWLLVAGHKAMFKGEGTINGEGEYGFQLNAIDEKLTPSTDIDMFRIKIWDKAAGELLYDNNLGSDPNADPTTEITGGSITIHKSNLKNARINDDVPDDFALRNYPNPFTNSTFIEFSLPYDSNVLLSIYNICGQQIKILSNKNYPAGTHHIEFHAEKFPAGQYLYQIKTVDFTQTNKMILHK